MAGDVPEQLLRAVAASDEAKPVELAFGVVERTFCLVPRLRERVAVLRHAPELFPLLRARFELLDLRAGAMEWSGGKRLLVDGESLDRGFFECLAEPGDWVAVVEVVEVAFSFGRGGRDIEAGLLAGAGEGDVAPLLQPLPAE